MRIEHNFVGIPLKADNISDTFTREYWSLIIKGEWRKEKNTFAFAFQILQIDSKARFVRIDTWEVANGYWPSPLHGIGNLERGGNSALIYHAFWCQENYEEAIDPPWDAHANIYMSKDSQSVWYSWFKLFSPSMNQNGKGNKEQIIKISSLLWFWHRSRNISKIPCQFNSFPFWIDNGIGNGKSNYQNINHELIQNAHGKVMGVHQNICLIHVAIAHMSLLFREYISFYKTIDIGSRLEVLKGHSCNIEAKCLF